ncbi:MAG: hypothetical protein AVDCRST_MAG03-3386, partial [uncultured Rubrobacteraceae bacterium]
GLRPRRRVSRPPRPALDARTRRAPRWDARGGEQPGRRNPRPRPHPDPV